MKHIILALSIIHSEMVFAQGLRPDLSCEGKTKQGETFTLLINDFEMSKTAAVIRGSSICEFELKNGEYSERAQVPLIMFDFIPKGRCKESDKFKLIQDGYLKIDDKNRTVHVHFLVGNQPLLCKISHFKDQKIKKTLERKRP
jgi:hypothetical protein